MNTKQIAVLATVTGIILIARSILIHPYVSYLKGWDIYNNLPLHMCGLSAIISGVIMFYRKQWMYELLYYWGIPGAFHSFLTPEFTQGTDGLLFIEYYVSHGGIIFSALFCTMFLGFKPRIGSWWRIFLWSQLLLPIIGGFNWLIDANYMYICAPPIAENPFIIGDFSRAFNWIRNSGSTSFCYRLFTIWTQVSTYIKNFRDSSYLTAST